MRGYLPKSILRLSVKNPFNLVVLCFMFFAFSSLFLPKISKAASPYDVEGNELQTIFNQRSGDLMYFQTSDLPSVISNISISATTTGCTAIRYIMLLKDINQTTLQTLYSDYNPTFPIQFEVNANLSNVRYIFLATDSSSTSSCTGNWQTILTSTANPTSYISNIYNSFSCVQNCTATPQILFDHIINYPPEFLYPTPNSTITGNVVHVVGYCNEANIGGNVIGLTFANRTDYITEIDTPIACVWNEAASRAMWSKDIEISTEADYTLAVFDSACYTRNPSDQCVSFVDFSVQSENSINPYDISIIYPEDRLGYNYFGGLVPSQNFPVRFSYKVLLDESVPIRYRDYSVDFYNCDDKTFSQCDAFPYQTLKIYDEENPNNSLDIAGVNRFTSTFIAASTTQEYSYRLNLKWNNDIVYTLNFTLAPSADGTVLPELPVHTYPSKLTPWIPRDGFYESRLENMKYLYGQRFPFNYITYLQAKFNLVSFSSTTTSTLISIPLDKVGVSGTLSGGDLSDSNVKSAWNYPRLIVTYLIWISVAFIILRDTLAIFKGSEAG